MRGSDTTFPKDYLAKREPSPAFEDAMSHKGKRKKERRRGGKEKEEREERTGAQKRAVMKT